MERATRHIRSSTAHANAAAMRGAPPHPQFKAACKRCGASAPVTALQLSRSVSARSAVPILRTFAVSPCLSTLAKNAPRNVQVTRLASPHTQSLCICYLAPVDWSKSLQCRVRSIFPHAFPLELQRFGHSRNGQLSIRAWIYSGVVRSVQVASNQTPDRASYRAGVASNNSTVFR